MDNINSQVTLENKYTRHCLGTYLDIYKREISKKLEIDLDEISSYWKILKYILIKKQITLAEMLGYLKGENIDKLEELIQNNWIIFNGNKLITVFDFEDSEKEEINKVRLPMPCLAIKEVKSNHECGYFTIKEKMVLNAISNIDNLDLNLDFINIINGYKLKLNPDPRLDLGKYGFNFNFRELLAEELEFFKDKIFYIPWRYDKRGRCYPNVFFINPQGMDLQKSLVELEEKETVDDTVEVYF